MSGERSGDLTAVIVLALVGAGLALFVDSGPLATAVLLPLVLILPGYALSALFFPPSSIDRDFRLLLTFALSISAAALSGVVVQIVLDLSRGVFVATLAAISIAASYRALRSRQANTDAAPPERVVLPRWALPSALAIALAIGIAAAAVALATEGVERQLEKSHFASIWLVPQKAPPQPPNSPPVKIGVASHERRQLEYLLRIRQGGTTLRKWRLRLAPGEEWSATLPAGLLRGPGTLVARLYQAGTPVRRVAIVLGAERVP